MARATPGRGPYTHLPPHDRPAEHAWVRHEVAAIEYPDSDDVTSLDPPINNRRVQWESAIDDEYSKRKQVLANLIRGADESLGPRNRLVHAAHDELDEAEAQRARLVERLRGPNRAPGTALQRPGEFDPTPARTYDDGGLPIQFVGTGFSWGTFAYGVALVIAGAADVAGFYQVLALLLGSWPWILIVLVLMCAVGSLFLMHVAGTEFKRFREQGRLWVSVLAITTWTLLGAGAFTVRLTVEEESATGPGAFTVLTGPPAFAAEDAWVKATVFLVVYVASGVLALVGGYATYDRARKQYAQATKAVGKANRKLTKAEKKRNRIIATIERIQDELGQERERWANARKERQAFAAELVSLVSVEIRKRVDDADERARIDSIDLDRLPKMKLHDLDANKREAIAEDEQKPPRARTHEELVQYGIPIRQLDKVSQ